jgi:hypothetical protein
MHEAISIGIAGFHPGGNNGLQGRFFVVVIMKKYKTEMQAGCNADWQMHRCATIAVSVMDTGTSWSS